MVRMRHTSDWIRRYLYMHPPYRSAAIVCLAFCISILAGIIFYDAPQTKEASSRICRPINLTPIMMSDDSMLHVASTELTPQLCNVSTPGHKEPINFSIATDPTNFIAHEVTERNKPIRMVNGAVHVKSTDGTIILVRLRETLPKQSSSGHLPFNTDFFSPPLASANPIPLYGETTTEGKPTRWSRQATIYEKNDILACPRNRSILHASMNKFFYRIRLAFGDVISQGYQPYQKHITLYAQKYNIPSALIIAIMHAESNFIPTAMSASNAHGLMQIVPETAGEEVHTYLTGVRTRPTTQNLLTPEYNIRYGTTYLYLLSNHHFKEITHPVTRQLCVIAAYNGGSNTVYKVFAAERNGAIDAINRLTPEQVYQALTTKMPSTESRYYVNKVVQYYHNYLSSTN